MQQRYGIKVVYRNYRGEVATRTLSPEYVWYGTTDWHPKEGYLLHAYDHDKQAYRDFALADCDFVGANHEPTAPHADDVAVDLFAAAMKVKLAKKRAEGRGGWEGGTCTAEILSSLLHEHVEKGDPLDVGNLAMMLHQRGERVAPASAEPVAWLSRYRSPHGDTLIVCQPDHRGIGWTEPFPVYAYPAPVTVEEDPRYVRADLYDALAKERDELKADIVRYRARLLDDLKSAKKTEAEVERLRRVLRGYKEDLCEGYCNEDEWADAGHCHPDFQRDCGGCRAACALQRKEGDER